MKPYTFILCAAFLVFIAIASCTKRDYYNNGGLASEPEADKQLSLYDYLKSKTGTFDSIVKMIDLSGTKNLINQDNITFYAPTNISVIRFQADMNKSTYSASKPQVKALDNINPDTLALVIKRFIIPDVRLELTQVYSDGAKDYKSIGGDTVNIYAIRGYFQGIAGNGAMQMQYIHKNADTSNYQTQMQTHNLVTKNAMLHVIDAASAYTCGLKIK